MWLTWKEISSRSWDEARSLDGRSAQAGRLQHPSTCAQTEIIRSEEHYVSFAKPGLIGMQIYVERVWQGKGRMGWLTSCGPSSLEAVLPCLAARMAGTGGAKPGFSGVVGARPPDHECEGVVIRWLAMKLWLVLLLHTSPESMI